MDTLTTKRGTYTHVPATINKNLTKLEQAINLHNLQVDHGLYRVATPVKSTSKKARKGRPNRRIASYAFTCLNCGCHNHPYQDPDMGLVCNFCYGKVIEN